MPKKKATVSFSREETEALQICRKLLVDIAKGAMNSPDALDRRLISDALPFYNAALTKIEDRTVSDPAPTGFDVAISNTGSGFFGIEGQSMRGRQWVNANVHGADRGMAWTDDSRLAADIAEGAASAGMVVDA